LFITVEISYQEKLVVIKALIYTGLDFNVIKRKWIHRNQLSQNIRAKQLDFSIILNLFNKKNKLPIPVKGNQRLFSRYHKQ
jgi:hypothetical protein